MHKIKKCSADKFKKMKQFIVVLLMVTIGFSACKEKRIPIEDQILKIKEMSQLGTVEYTVTKVISASDNQTWFKVGDRKILFSCEGTIKAGIDLSSLSAKDIQTDGDKVTLTLPHAKLIYLNIEPNSIKEVYSSVSILRSSFDVEEKNGLLVQGQKNIEKSVDSIGILQDAEKNAKHLIEAWLSPLNLSNINIIYK